MNLTRRARGLAVCACFGTILVALGVPAWVGAQDADRAPPVTRDTSPQTDEELGQRVKAALHKDPYFYDEHVDVSVEHGAVVLRGFVFSDADLHNAIRIATKAAGGRKVVNNLTIKQGGRR
jgi:osmotically-inducible protein OsmY